jgi:diadenosine tetraphosphate (Ap4A) HIT family hydrolase
VAFELGCPSDRVRRRRLWSLKVGWQLSRRPPEECFVCEIVAGNPRLPHDIVYEDDDAIAFLGRWPALWGLTLVCPKAHREQVTGDFTEDEYLRLQTVVRRVGEAVRATVPCERLYVMSLGSESGNRHVHWHLAPLPPGVPRLLQQCRSFEELLVGRLDVPESEMWDLAAHIRRRLEGADAP